MMVPYRTLSPRASIVAEFACELFASKVEPNKFSYCVRQLILFPSLHAEALSCIPMVHTTYTSGIETK